jgi:hypothetical protein
LQRASSSLLFKRALGSACRSNFFAEGPLFNASSGVAMLDKASFGDVNLKPTFVMFFAPW